MCEYNERLHNGPRNCPVGLIEADSERLKKITIDRSIYMVCFTARIILPLQRDANINDYNDVHLRHIIKHYTNSMLYDRDSLVSKQRCYDITLCENDICDFIDSLPKPFFIDYIDYSCTNLRLYTNKRIKNDTQIYPRSPYENHIYWKAIYAERNML